MQRFLCLHTSTESKERRQKHYLLEGTQFSVQVQHWWQVPDIQLLALMYLALPAILSNHGYPIPFLLAKFLGLSTHKFRWVLDQDLPETLFLGKPCLTILSPQT